MEASTCFALLGVILMLFYILMGAAEHLKVQMLTNKNVDVNTQHAIIHCTALEIDEFNDSLKQLSHFTQNNQNKSNMYITKIAIYYLTSKFSCIS